MRVNYGPVLRIFNRLADDPGRSEALDAALRRFTRTHDHGEPATRASRPSTSSRWPAAADPRVRGQTPNVRFELTHTYRGQARLCAPDPKPVFRPARAREAVS